MQTRDVLEKFGFCRVGAGSPAVTPADVDANVAAMVSMAMLAGVQGADILVLPELSLAGYTCADLFHSATLLERVEQGVAEFLRATRDCRVLCFFGAPLRWQGNLYNCALVAQQGVLLGVVPKSYPLAKGEHYETRWFTPGADITGQCMRLDGFEVPFGVDLLFEARGNRNLVVGVELGGDYRAFTPPSAALTANGATLICNPSADSAEVGAGGDRRTLIEAHSHRYLTAWALAGAGAGESTTDLVYDGHLLIAEDGSTLAEGNHTTLRDGLLLVDIDPEYLQYARRRSPYFGACNRGNTPLRRIPFGFDKQVTANSGRSLRRAFNPHPFVPQSPEVLAEFCGEALSIQATGLATRLKRTKMRTVVIGVSGGLDSALALLVVNMCFRQLGLELSGVHAITMPGFGTTQGTLTCARKLCAGLGIKLEEIDIKPACRQHLADIGHDGTQHDPAYENVQARERTQILMDRANMLGALVVGTGDLSELALGWCTFNGDHISMYNVNCGVPKTLAACLVRWVAEHLQSPEAKEALLTILNTPVSPELLPLDATGKTTQQTEKQIGPYELHDFFIHHFLQRGASEEKIAFLAQTAFAGRYTEDEIAKWLNIFMTRFLSQQFKRSCMPDGPKVVAITLSPRSGWRMPSDLAAGALRGN